MIIELTKNISQSQEDHIISAIATLGLNASPVTTGAQKYLIALGKKSCDVRCIGTLPGVSEIHVVSNAYQLVSRVWKKSHTTITIDHDTHIGPRNFQLIAGPCALEDEDQIQKTIDFLASQKISMVRGGAFKPRTSPYTFRGLGLKGLELFSKIAKPKNIKIISEVLEPSQIHQMYPYVDVFQVGARNSQNFSLLSELGKVDKPVLLKRGISGSIDELLQSAEYIFSSGNENIILCERGIRTFETSYRNTVDINAIPLLKDKTHLPVILDPSHGIGIRKYVRSIALAGVAAGADGLIVETHPCPEKSVSDSEQTISFDEVELLKSQVKQILDLHLYEN
jgi:3-deoxy-7-phosphoheptulonate synthase